MSLARRRKRIRPNYEVGCNGSIPGFYPGGWVQIPLAHFRGFVDVEFRFGRLFKLRLAIGCPQRISTGGQRQDTAL